jgi:hypothetical protein
MLPRFTFVASFALVLGLSARADELKLKDGTKIVGTIVGFEENSFKVKTSYGFAVVQRDQVVSINVAEAARKSDAEKKPDAENTPESENKSSAAKKVDPAADNVAPPAKPAKNEAAVAASVPARVSLAGPKNASGTLQPASAVPPKSPPAANSATVASSTSAPVANSVPVANATPAGATVPASAVASASAPAKPVEPEPIREEVRGNAYVNDTYGFRMYKPPDWDLIAGARTLLPGAITAMGTNDQKTYLLIGQDAAGKSLVATLDTTETRIREVMENFRPLGEKRVAISGSEALERRFRGSVDNHDWSGIVVVVPRGKRVYTIFGMTYADNDLVQIQENVISRAISSLQFTK